MKDEAPLLRLMILALLAEVLYGLSFPWRGFTDPNTPILILT